MITRNLDEGRLVDGTIHKALRAVGRSASEVGKEEMEGRGTVENGMVTVW